MRNSRAKSRNFLISTSLVAMTASLVTSAVLAQDNAAHHAQINLSDASYLAPGGETTDGNGVTVAVLDGLAKADHEDLSNVTQIELPGGTYSGADIHGTHVAGIIAADNNGFGAQGVAPNASILSYGMFDDNGWTPGAGVREALFDAKSRGATIANASFGFPGELVSAQDLNDIEGTGILYVKAAGNDGVVGRAVRRGPRFSELSNLMLVGSIDANDQISSFSNRPGEACLTGRQCAETEKMKYKFLVAPGENINSTLHDGGYAGLSGTSMAAPVVAGAAAVIQSRWEWLQQDAGKTADVLFKSARDLGAAGVDAVYGHGALDMAAALQPIGDVTIGDGDNTGDGGTGDGATDGTGAVDNCAGLRGREKKRCRQNRRAANAFLSTNSVLPVAAFAGQSLTVFDSLGRDFKMDLDAMVASQQSAAQAKREARRLASLQQRAKRLKKRGGKRRGKGRRLALSADPSSMLSQDVKGLNFAMGYGNLDRYAGALSGSTSFAEVETRSGRAADTLGMQDNPVAALADGGAYAIAKHSNSFGSFGDLNLSFVGQQAGVDLEVENPELATSFAYGVNADYQLNDTFALRAGVTRLSETDALLGNTSGGALSFGSGVTTDAINLGFAWKASSRTLLEGSYTNARTKAFAGGDVLSSATGLLSDAWNLRLAGMQVFNKNDSLAFGLSQPLRTRSGSLDVTNQVVVNRDDRSLGYTTDTIQLGAQSREINASFAYARDIWEDQASWEVSATRRFNAGHVGGIHETEVSAGFAFSF